MTLIRLKRQSFERKKGKKKNEEDIFRLVST